MALLTLTKTDSGTSFSIDENNISKVYAQGSGAVVKYSDSDEGFLKSITVDETLTAVLALATKLVQTTIDGGSILLNTDRVIMTSEVSSLCIVNYSAPASQPENLNLDVTEAVFLAAWASAGTNNVTEQTIEVDITAANILAMNGAPVEVVAAAGAGTALEFVSAVLVYDYDTATFGGGGDVTIDYSGGASVSTTIAAANAFGAAGDKVFSMARLNAAGGYTMPVNTGLDITNATGAFTDPGTAAGVGRLQITYKVHITGL